MQLFPILNILKKIINKTSLILFIYFISCAVRAEEKSVIIDEKSAPTIQENKVEEKPPVIKAEAKKAVKSKPKATNKSKINSKKTKTKKIIHKKIIKKIMLKKSRKSKFKGQAY